MSKAVYTIPATPPSLNEFIGRENVWEYRRIKQDWKNYCMMFCHPKSTPERARVSVTYFFPKNCRHDADNYLKFLLDGLVAAGVIQDDDFRHCKIGDLDASVDKTNPRTVITVEEI